MSPALKRHTSGNTSVQDVIVGGAPSFQAFDDRYLYESAQVISAAGNAQTLDVSQHTAFDLTLTAATCTLSLVGAVANRATTISVVLRQDSTGGRVVAWPAVTWTSGSAPTLKTAGNAIDVIQFATTNGTNWFAYYDVTASGVSNYATLNSPAFTGTPSAPSLRLNGIQNKSSDYTALSTDSLILATGGASGINITSPAAVIGQQVSVKKIDAGVGNVTFTPATGTVDGASSYIISQRYLSVTFINDGVNWWAV